MTAKNPGRRGRPWRELRSTVLAEEVYCHYCHLLVDKALPGRHPYGPSVDHVIPVSMGGPPLERANVRLMHMRCNASRGNRLHAKPPRWSRLW